MSYALRNTLILLLTLALFVGGAFSYIKFIQLPKLEQLEETRAAKQEEYNSKKAISDAFPALNATYLEAVSIIENYDKSLFKEPNSDYVYDYLNYISGSSPSSQVYFDYVFTDSTAEDQYGILRSDINGYANYRNLVNFINKLENSQLLNKVTNLSISPAGGNNEELEEVTFSFTLQSYYERVPIQEGGDYTSQLTMNEEVSLYNPFYPLIQPSLPPNEENLINVEQSRIIGLTSSRIFLVDQGGNVSSLRVGDQVYLGELESIDINNQSATFNLNKGGITELVTLEIEQ